MVSSGDEAMAAALREQPDLAILDAELSGIHGYEVARRIKAAGANCRVVLVMGKRISSSQMQNVAASGCDEVLIAPMSADELYDVVAIQLGLPRAGAERYTVSVALQTSAGPELLDAQISNLSVDGARFVLPIAQTRYVGEGTQLGFTVTPEPPADGDAPLEIRARVVWAQRSEHEAVIGASFEGLGDDERRRLSELTQWEVVQETECTRIVLKGDITEATHFDALLTLMVGRVDFDLSQVRYMNSLGVREWVEFLRKANTQGYEFHACSPPFVLQASMVEGVLGCGTVTSFFAPYHCEDCDHQEDKLLQSAAILAANHRPPTFTCADCNGLMLLDDIPERYLAFLRPDLLAGG